MKDAILNAFEKVGGEDYLVEVARTDPRTSCALLGKVMPQQLNEEPEMQEIRKIVVTFVDGKTGEEIPQGCRTRSSPPPLLEQLNGKPWR